MVDKKQRDRKQEETIRPQSGSEKEFLPPSNLDGKTDSGPEPDVFGREIPPQKGEGNS